MIISTDKHFITANLAVDTHMSKMRFIIFLVLLSAKTVLNAKNPVLPPEFGAIFFGTTIGATRANLAVVGEIYMSEKLNMGATINRRAGDTGYQIFDYKTNKVLIASKDENECLINDISSYLEGVNPRSILNKMLKNLTRSEVTGDYVNGIEVVEWKNGNEIVSKFAVENRNFSTPPYGNWSRPVFLATTEKRSTGNGSFVEVYYTYFFLALMDTLPEEVFAPPHAILCQGFSDTSRAFPALASEYRVNIESVDANGAKTNTKMFYSEELKMHRQDVLKGVGHSYSLYTDRNFGVQYTIDYDSGNCLSVVELEPTSPSTPNQLVYGAGNAAKFLFRGNRSCWQGMCGVWTGAVDGAVHEIYLKEVVEDGLGGKRSGYVPVRMETKPLSDFPMIEIAKEYHYFNYEPGYFNWNKFDVSDCYKEKFKLRFQVSLKGNYSDIMSLPDFQRKFRIAVVQHTQVAQTRLHEIRVDNFADEIVVVTLTLLEKPKYAGPNPTHDIDIRNNSIYNKISNTVYDGNFIVTTKRKSGGEMILSGLSTTREIISVEKIDEKGSSFVKFELQRRKMFPVGKTDLVIEGLSVDACAKKCEDERSSVCDLFMYCPATRECTLSSTSFEERKDSNYSDTCNLYKKNYAFDFDLDEGFRLKFTDKDSKSTKLDLQQCFSQCFQGKIDAVACHSIDFCIDGQQKTCVYHALHKMQTSRADLIRDPNCLHYSMKYLQMFHAMPGRSIKDLDSKYVEVKFEVSAAMCASMCMSAPDGCTDFEICLPFPGTKMKRVCKVLKQKTSAVGQKVEYVANPECDHYRLKGLKTSFNFDDFGENKPVKPEPVRTSGGYGGNTMAGAGFGMVIVGVGIGFAATYFYAKKQYTKGNEDNFVMQLVND